MIGLGSDKKTNQYIFVKPNVFTEVSFEKKNDQR